MERTALFGGVFNIDVELAAQLLEIFHLFFIVVVFVV
jgi:hypothetical protein